MARGSNSRDGRTARTEFPGGASDRGFASEGGSAGMPSPERIQAFYSPTSQLYTPLSGKEHRQFARSVLLDAFASSEWSDLGFPDSQYAMDALDAMQKMSERWTASGKAPTMAETTEFREIAKRAVESMNDELNQEARALRAEYNREEGGGRAARSEAGFPAGVPTQPDGSPTKFKGTRESLRQIALGVPTTNGGIKSTQEYAKKMVNAYLGRVAFGIDIDDLPDSNKIWDKIGKVQKTMDGWIKNPATATDESIAKWKKSAASAAKSIARLAMKDEL